MSNTDQTVRITPLQVPARRRLPNVPSGARLLECIQCQTMTNHQQGPITHAKDGTPLVRWWKCTECDEAQRPG
jgi:hypothetical protein